jgi:hypothetical protein
VWNFKLASPVAPEGTDPYRTAGTFLRWDDQRHAVLLDRLAVLTAQAKTNGAMLTEVKTVLSSLDLTRLPADIAATLSGLRLVLEGGS